MIRINQIKLPIGHSQKELREKIKKKLKLRNDDFSISIIKKSIDARKKPELFYIYAVAVDTKNEKQILNRIKDSSVCLYKKPRYIFPDRGEKELKYRPVIIGAGPAGLFCAYILTISGYSPIVLERGRKIEERRNDVEKFWATGVLNPKSNVQFGEGGAGTFSDGKLNTSVKDPMGRNSFVLETFVKFGAGDNILYGNKPHIGTDVLSDVIINMRNYLIENGCEFRFESCVDDFFIEDNQITGISINNKVINTDVCVLAPGHSARDTFRILEKKSVNMECKNFAVGFRVEHPQAMINENMYGRQKDIILPASPYKVTSNFPNGRGVYSFCMCPGGYVVNSSSDDGMTVVNGMSYSGRSGKNANSAIIVSVNKDDFEGFDALSGVRFQEKLEIENFNRGKGKIPQQLYGDFCDNRISSCYGDFESQTKGTVIFESLNGLLTPDMEESFKLGMEHFSKIIDNFDRKDAILSGMETRTSSPLRINRDECFESNIKGLYPCGEGAGYAGGITSAAIDGIKVAEAIIKKFRLCDTVD